MSDKPASPARGRKKTAPPAQQPPQEEVVVRLPLTDLYPFPDHPFQVRDDEEMKETIQSVKEYGVIVPAIVRPREEGGYDTYTKAKDKSAFRSKYEAELVIFEAAKSTLLAIQGDGQLPSLKSLKAEQEQLAQEQQRLYEERANLKKQVRMIDTMKANVDDYLSPTAAQDRGKRRGSELE